jgi:hypothetical protein
VDGIRGHFYHGIAFSRIGGMKKAMQEWAWNKVDVGKENDVQGKE